ncbi:MAG: hypothetical protein J6B75_10940 [Ruminococcus sp.]|nr:hypothetical protein [Ruminococcus sp.]MBO5164931.1 hypothetical protein [Ruminococcus sp.]
MEQHNKIINAVAKQYLASEGLFRVGSSRNWIDDNGYFLTIVEFQPSSYSRGTYLNVGINFMWEKSEGLNDTLSFDCGGRVIIGKGTQFAEYRERLKNGDEIFTAEVEKFAAAALEKVKEYRRLCDLDNAEKQLLVKTRQTQKDCMFWEMYDLAMLCFFKGDFNRGKNCFNSFLDTAKNSVLGNTYCEWIEEFYNYCISEIVPQIDSADTAQKMVFEMINRRRKYFNNKSSYKKMRKDIIF